VHTGSVVKKITNANAKVNAISIVDANAGSPFPNYINKETNPLNPMHPTLFVVFKNVRR
jgi:hypothetical protein